jgi:hypothetical protein
VLISHCLAFISEKIVDRLNIPSLDIIISVPKVLIVCGTDKISDTSKHIECFPNKRYIYDFDVNSELHSQNIKLPFAAAPLPAGECIGGPNSAATLPSCF